jgi:hypothetical protein
MKNPVDLKQAARDAVAFALPLLERSTTDATVGQSGVMHVVVMDPSRRPGLCAFEEAILYEQTVGKDHSAWDADYAAYARAKARISWQTGRDSHAVYASSPHLLAADDWPVWGSAVVDGIVVGVSGAVEI